MKFTMYHTVYHTVYTWNFEIIYLENIWQTLSGNNDRRSGLTIRATYTHTTRLYVDE